MHAKRGPAALTPQRARAILGLAPDATPEQIEAAFRRAIRVAHPDRGGEPGRAELLIDARRCLREVGGPPAREPRQVVVVAEPTWRDVTTSVFARFRPSTRRPSRVR